MPGIPHAACNMYWRIYNPAMNFTVEDTRDYGGEQRFNSTGFLGAAIVTISHTESETEIHIISMRKADAHEIETLIHYL